MKRKFQKKRPKEDHGNLDHQVEVLRHNPRNSDTVDPDLESHVLPYLQKLFGGLQAPQVDLTSAEAAKDSLKTIELTMAEIDSAIHRTRSLRMQLEQKRSSEKGRK